MNAFSRLYGVGSQVCNCDFHPQLVGQFTGGLWSQVGTNSHIGNELKNLDGIRCDTADPVADPDIVFSVDTHLES